LHTLFTHAALLHHNRSTCCRLRSPFYHVTCTVPYRIPLLPCTFAFVRLILLCCVIPVSHTLIADTTAAFRSWLPGFAIPTFVAMPVSSVPVATFRLLAGGSCDFFAFSPSVGATLQLGRFICTVLLIPVLHRSVLLDYRYGIAFARYRLLPTWICGFTIPVRSPAHHHHARFYRACRACYMPGCLVRATAWRGSA